MKIDISDALFALGIKEWVLRGEPTTEDEFNQMFRKITGADKNNSAIESSDPSDFGTTWKLVQAVVQPRASLLGMCHINLSETEQNRLKSDATKHDDDEEDDVMVQDSDDEKDVAGVEESKEEEVVS